MTIAGEPVMQAVARPRIALFGAVGGLGLAEHLRAAGADVLDHEPAPQGASDALARRHGYRRLSARTGDVGCLSALVEVLRLARGGSLPADWIRTGADGRLRDGFRVGVDPDGFEDADEVLFLRHAHHAALLSVLRDADVLILILSGEGCLVDPKHGTHYAYAAGSGAEPRAKAGLAHVFPDLMQLNDDFLALRGLVADINPGLMLRLALLPMEVDPGAAAKDLSGHLPVLRQLSDLRVLMAHWSAAFADVSYVPIWELCTGPLEQAGLFKSVSGELAPEGGARVASLCLGSSPREDVVIAAPMPAAPDDPEDIAQKKARRAERRAKRAAKGAASASVICEEELLEAFSK